MSRYTENPSEAELILLGIDSEMNRLHKAAAGIVRSYDPTTNTANIQPAVKHAMPTESDDRVFDDLPELPNVPVIFPRSGGFVARMPISPGDTVLLVYLDQSHAEWRMNGGITEPEDARRHSIGHVVAIPGFFPDVSPMASTDAAATSSGQAIIGQDGGKQMRIGPTGIELAPAGTTPVMPIALAPPILTQMAAMQTALANIQAWIALASPFIAAIPAPLTDPQKLSLGGAVTTSGTSVTAVATGAVDLNANAPSTLVRSV